MSQRSSQGLVDRALQLADQDAATSVFTIRLDDEAVSRAMAIDTLKASGAPGRFLGIPFTVKDNFNLAGHATTAGSKLLAGSREQPANATVTDRMLRQGFVLLGRTNMTEFAFSGLGLNPHFGTPINPAFPGEIRIPGGSSSGAAVSVALGISPVALGTDTGGSVRIPAALCGITGFKPTSSAVSQEGILPLSTTLDAVGILAATALECAEIFDVIRDREGSGRRQSLAQHLRVGIVQNYVRQDEACEVTAAFEAALDRWRDAGVAIEDVEIPEFDEIPAMMRDASFPAAESAAWHASHLGLGRHNEYDPRVVARIVAGQSMSAPAYVALVEKRNAFISAMSNRAYGFDAIAWPTVPFIAPKLEALDSDESYFRANAIALRNSTVVNLFDGCAVSIPCTRKEGPVGCTLAALSGQDDKLLSLAITLQSLQQEQVG